MVDEIREDETAGEEYVETPTRRYGNTAIPSAAVHIETGRGQTSEVPVGAPFQSTIERLAEEAHYGGYFRVFLNGDEILDPGEAPGTIEAGMRIALCSFDKVG